MRNPSIGACCLIVLAAAPGNPAAAQRTDVAVRFVLADPAYRANYKAAEILEIERRAAETIVRKLDRDIGFLAFKSTGAAGHTLTFTLARRDRSRSSGPDDIGFYAKLDGPGLQLPDQYWFTFREGHSSERRGLPEEFLTKVAQKIAIAESEQLTSALLSSIPISTTGFLLVEDRIGWVLPLLRKDLCLAFLSTLRIDNKIQTSAGPEVMTFLAVARGDYDPPGGIPPRIKAAKHSVVARATVQQENLDLLRTGAQGVQVQAVYMHKYQFDPTLCVRAIEPARAFPTSGGQP